MEFFEKFFVEEAGFIVEDKVISNAFQKLLYENCHDDRDKKIFDENNIYDELIETPKEQVLEISKMVFDAPYNYLFLNTDSGKMFKNFDEIIIE